jgi:osmotically-inducible protein OsmY
MKNDNVLKKDVTEELKWEPQVKADGIGVSAKGGVVTLTGSVGSYSEDLAAWTAANRVPGVMEVADELGVYLPDSHNWDDDDLARSTANAIRWNANVPDRCIKVSVKDGWVTLEGDVCRQYEKSAAEEAVLRQRGLRGVSNEIVVKPAAPGTSSPSPREAT